MLVETAPQIIDFCEQCERIQGVVNGELVESIIDYWLLYADGTEVYREIKYSADLQPSSKKFGKALRQISAQKEYCSRNSYNHEVFTDENIRDKRLLITNLRFLIPFGRDERRCKEAEKLVLKELMKFEQLSIYKLYKNINYNEESLKYAVYYLLYKRRLQADLDNQPLGPRTEVRLCQNQE
ncbi:TnsA endonuclease N-terminal domain-containing protein [Desulforamulus aeronauticus]|uniref:TnsA endonuclease N-terminal domain-containing protein n=1 Tax=Desulforamulus aeronauticus TaxID=53343 RepID=UPI001114B0E3|nr:TnsA endonuclease N-terminal domain-containing protein [Desulforamulus aeronauticus]